MKPIIFIQIIEVFLLLSCATTGSIQVSRDDFRNLTVISMEQRLYANESAWALSPPYDLTIIYMRLFAKDPVLSGAEAGEKPMHLFIRIGGLPTRNWMLNAEGALKIDGENVPVKLESRYSGISSVQSFYNPASGSVYATATRTGSGGFVLSDAVRKKIENCSELAVRFYAADKVMTFVYGKEELGKLKEFLAFDESKNAVEIKKIDIK